MPGTPTPNLQLIVPTVGGDANIWGNELNTNLGTLDNLALAFTSNQSASFTAAANTFGPENAYKVTTGGSTITATLPTPSTCTGKIINVKKVDAGVGSVTVSATPAVIDGNNTYVINAQYQFVRVQSNGTSWDILGYG